MPRRKAFDDAQPASQIAVIPSSASLASFPAAVVSVPEPEPSLPVPLGEVKTLGAIS
jgi:hypothetical protein